MCRTRWHWRHAGQMFDAADVRRTMHSAPPACRASSLSSRSSGGDSAAGANRCPPNRSTDAVPDRHELEAGGTSSAFDDPRIFRPCCRLQGAWKAMRRRSPGGPAASKQRVEARRLGGQHLRHVAGQRRHAGGLVGVGRSSFQQVAVILDLHATARGGDDDGLDLSRPISGHQASMLRRASSRPPSWSSR